MNLKHVEIKRARFLYVYEMIFQYVEVELEAIRNTVIYFVA